MKKGESEREKENVAMKSFIYRSKLFSQFENPKNICQPRHYQVSEGEEFLANLGK